MLHTLRRRAEDEKGFTLIELLVVILIIGILAAIAIPTFLNQKSKANDASAESLARNAATAMETYATNNNGSYSNVNTSAAELHHARAQHHVERDSGVPVVGRRYGHELLDRRRLADRHRNFTLTNTNGTEASAAPRPAPALATSAAPGKR